MTDERNPVPALPDEGPDPHSSMTQTSSTGNTTHDLRKDAEDALRMLRGTRRNTQEFGVSNQTGELAHPTQSTHFTAGHRLRIVIDELPVMTVSVDRDLVIGRSDSVAEFTPDIDLTTFGAYRLGISRRHAIIVRHDQHLVLQDESSRNGTFINGRRMEQGEQAILHDGDELQIGNLVLRVRFISAS